MSDTPVRWAILGTPLPRLVPAPGSLPLVDHTLQQVNPVIAVIGDAAGAWVESRLQQELFGRAPETEADALGYVSVGLGEVAGFETTFHIYGIGTEPEGREHRVEACGAAQVLICLGPAVSAAREAITTRGTPIPLVLVGEPLDEAWPIGSVILQRGNDAPGAAALAFKAAAREALESLRPRA